MKNNLKNTLFQYCIKQIVGCIGCDKDIPEEMIKYELQKEWNKMFTF